MDWRDEAIEEVVERREGSGGRLRRDGTIAEAASELKGPGQRRRQWSRVERWLREQMRRPGAWLVLGAVWLVVPAFFGMVGQPLWWSLSQWVAGCVYVGLAYHAVRRHVAFAPAVMMALGCGVNALTSAAMIEPVPGEAGLGGMWMAVAMLGGLIGLETLRDATWWPVRLLGSAAAGGLVVWGSGGSPAGLAVAGLAAAAGLYDATRRSASWSTTVIGLVGLLAGVVVVSLGGLSAVTPMVWADGRVGWSDAGVILGVITGWWAGLTSVSAWWPPSAGGGVMAWLIAAWAVLAWPALAYGWWSWARRSRGLLVACCPWAALLAGSGASMWAVLLALMPMTWLTVWLLAKRYHKRRLTLMAGLVAGQLALTVLMLVMPDIDGG